VEIELHVFLNLGEYWASRYGLFISVDS